jgi:hypothetical protein
MVTKHRATTKKQDERDERRSQAKQTIDDSVKALLEELRAGKTEHLIQWMQYCAQFHRYSVINQHLIEGQCRRRGLHASHVASYNAWQTLGNKRYGKPYQVRRSEKALFIWAPRPFVKTEVNKQTKEEEEHAYTGFVLVPVFADFQIAQGTDETGYEHPPLEGFFTPQPSSEEAAHLYETLRTIATDEGFICQEQDRLDMLQGFSQGKVIVVKASLDATSKFCTFVHEYTHGCLHQHTGLGKRDVELEAESVAYIVASAFGIRNPFSSDYLLGYGNDEKSLLARLESIRKTGHEIIAKIEQAFGTAESEVSEEAAAA